MPETTQLDRIESRLARIEQKLDLDLSLSRAQLQEQFLMATNLDGITQQVTATQDAEQAAIVLLGQLHDMLVAAGTDQSKLDALAEQLRTNKEALAAAIVANTPAAPTT
jgi:hypothetical protein